jgi:hypothetical protein
MKPFLSCLVIGVLLLPSYFLNAQIRTTISTPQEIDETFGFDQIPELPFQSIEVIDEGLMEALMLEDSIANLENAPYRFATLMEVDITPENNGIWYEDQGIQKWVVGIHAQGAQSLSLVFQNLVLPADGQLYIINGEKKLIHGPIKESNIPDTDELPTEVFDSDRLIVYFEAPGEFEENWNIEISEIGYGYKGSKSLSLECNVDIIDEEGDCYRMEQLAVAKILIEKNTAFCTGTLINNTDANNDLPPYLLTANHCTVKGGELRDLGTFFFRFKDWANSPGWVTYHGATQRVGTGPISDCSLLELAIP